MVTKMLQKDLENEIKYLKEVIAEKDRIINFINEGIYINSKEYDIEYLNEEMINIIGGDKVGQKCYKAIYEKDEVCEWCNFDKLQKGKTSKIEVYHPGSEKYFNVTSYLLDHGSKLSHYHDISNRVKNQNIISKLNTAVEQSSNTIVITDLNGKIEYVNRKFSDITGYSIVEVIGANPKILNAGTQPKEYYAEMWKTITAGKTWKGEFNNKKKNGELFWEIVTITPIKDEKGAITNYLAIKEDFTARKKAEEALKASEEKFRKLFDAVPALLDAFDENGKCIYWNKECEKVFGWTIDEINAVENSLALFYPDPNIQKQVLESVTDQPDIEFKEWHPKTKNGDERIVMWANVSLDDGTVINIGHDITELKRTEQELKESNDTKDRFFSIIAHDLKSPFTAILGFTNMLKENYKEYDDEKIERMIHSILNSANGAYELLENLLTWSRSQSGKITFLPEEIHLKVLLFETVYGLKEMANKKNINIVDNITESDIVFADRNMIAVVIRNLVANAIKFTNKNGTVTINCNKQNDNNYCEMSISDTGIGIAKGRIHELFRIDKNISTQGTENERGTGLGLILCKEFIEKHGGKIYVDSELNEGTTVRFTIPIHSNVMKYS